VEALATAIKPYLDVPTAFFGHSMGALVSFELARYLFSQGHSVPRRLFVSACRAPQLPDLEPPICTLPTGAFIAELQRLHGTPTELLQNRECMELLLPALRADFAVCETYTYLSQPPLPIPINAYGGLEDKVIGLEQLEAWRAQTSAYFRLRLLHGDHFFLDSRRAELLADIADSLVIAPAGFAHGPGE
jgi:medium-chain acyl-[acyl-carrier-protein] hydrolase